ncbi:methionine permease [Dispira simplex]|nr:methionine permease [Dispira simplex]
MANEKSPIFGESHYAQVANDAFVTPFQTISEKEDVAEEPKLQQTIGLVSGSALVAGLMTGSGIFSTPGLTLTLMGSPGATLIMWLLGAVITFCGAACYIELGTLFPKSGGDQLYLDSIFRNPRGLMGFLFTFIFLLCVEPGSIAANATVFGEYILYATVGPKNRITNPYILDNLGWLQRAIGILGVTIAFAMSMFSVKWALRFQTAFTWLKIAVLALISVSGMVIISGVTHVPMSSLWKHPFRGTTTVQQVCSTLFRVLWAYDGFKGLNFCLGEVKNPQRNLILCSSFGTGLVTIFYSLTIVSLFAVVSMEETLASQELLAGLWGTKVFGSVFGEVVVPLAVAISCLGSTAATVFPFSRVIVEASSLGYIPYGHYWSRIHPRFGTPLLGLCLGYAVTIVYLLAPPPGEVFSMLIDIVGYPNWLFTGITITGLAYFRYIEPSLHRPFRVWLPLAFVYMVVALFLSVIPFVPPANGKVVSDHGVPYYVSPLVAVIVILLGFPTWYYQFYRQQSKG